VRVSVDQDVCCGAGQCVLLVPEVFDQRDDGVVVLLDPAPPEERRTAVREAAAVCPSGAIHLDPATVRRPSG
jgi:ferredoxin